MSRSNAEAEGGIGNHHESLVGAYLLAQLAVSGSIPGLDGDIVRVEMQIGHEVPKVDDYRFTLRLHDLKRPVYLQAKRSAAPRPSDEPFRKTLKGIYDAVDALEPEAIFVLATEKIGRENQKDLERLLDTAAGSSDFSVFQKKVANPPDKLQAVWENCVSAIDKAIQEENEDADREGGRTTANPCDQGKLYKALSKTRLWVTLLEDRGRDYQDAVKALSTQVSGGSHDQARRVFEGIYVAVSAGKSRRHDYDLDRLRTSFKLSPPPRPDPVATALSREYVEQAGSRLVSVISALKSGTAFEAYCELEHLIDDAERLVPDLATGVGTLKVALREVVGRALLARWEAVLALGMKKEVTRWRTRATSYFGLLPSLIGKAVVLATVFDDGDVVSDLRDLVPISDLKLVEAADALASTGDGSAAAKLVGDRGENWTLARDLLLAYIADQGRYVQDPLRSFHIARDALASDEVPSAVLGLMACIALVSSVEGVGYYEAAPAGWSAGKVLDTIRSAEREIWSKGTGAFEWNAMMDIAFRCQALRIPTPEPSRPPETIRYFAKTLPVRSAATLALHLSAVGFTDLAEAVLDEAEGLDTDEGAAEVERIRRAIRGEETAEDILPDTSKLPPQPQAAMRAQAIRLHRSEGRDVREDERIFLEDYGGTSFAHEVRVRQAIEASDWEAALPEIGSLLTGFPEALGVHLHCLETVALGLQEAKEHHRRDRPIHIDFGEPDLDDVAESWRVRSMSLARHVAEHQRHGYGYHIWTVLASWAAGTDELLNVATSARASGFEVEALRAEALAALGDREYEKVVGRVDEILSQGGSLDRLLRSFYDQARFWTGRHLDLIADRSRLLEQKGRHPMQAMPTMQAFWLLKRSDEAYEFAIQNATDFAGNADAEWLVLLAAFRRGLGPNDTARIESFFRDHPNDPRFYAVSVDEKDPAEVIQGGIDEEQRLQGLYEDIQLPLSWLGADFIGRWLHQRNRIEGLQALRMGVGRRSPSSGGPLLLDLSALLTIGLFDLWPALEKWGEKLLIHAATRQTVHESAIVATLEESDRIFAEGTSINELLARLGVVKYHQLPTELLRSPHEVTSFAEKDGRLAKSLGAQLVSSFDEDAVGLMHVIDGALASKRIGVNTHSRWGRALEPHLMGATSRRRDEFNPRVLLSSIDLIELHRARILEEFVRSMDEVIAGPGTLFMLSLSYGQAVANQEKGNLVRRLEENIRSRLDNGILTEVDGPRPPFAGLPYLNLMCRCAKDNSAAIWSDESFDAGHYEANGVETANSMWVLGEAYSRAALTHEEMEEHLVDMTLSGYRDIRTGTVMASAWKGADPAGRLLKTAGRLGFLLQAKRSRSSEEHLMYLQLILRELVCLMALPDPPEVDTMESVIEAILTKLPGPADREWMVTHDGLQATIPAGSFDARTPTLLLSGLLLRVAKELGEKGRSVGYALGVRALKRGWVTMPELTRHWRDVFVHYAWLGKMPPANPFLAFYEAWHLVRRDPRQEAAAAD